MTAGAGRPFRTFLDLRRLFAGKHLLRLADAHVVNALVGLMFMAGAAFFVRAFRAADLGPEDEGPNRGGVGGGLGKGRRRPSRARKALDGGDPRLKLPDPDGCGLASGDLPDLGPLRRKKGGGRRGLLTRDAGKARGMRGWLNSALGPPTMPRGDRLRESWRGGRRGERPDMMPWDPCGPGMGPGDSGGGLRGGDLSRLGDPGRRLDTRLHLEWLKLVMELTSA